MIAKNVAKDGFEKIEGSYVVKVDSTNLINAI